jgi:outer membrane lipoprotein
MVKENPEAYKGMEVVWGGKILKVVNKKKGTLLEVLEFPLGNDNRPLDSDISQGRFIVSLKDFIDPAIYQEGRELTVQAAVAGVKDLPLGEITYKYVLLKGARLKLWKKRPQVIRVYHTGDALWGVRPAGSGAYWYWGPYYWW